MQHNIFLAVVVDVFVVAFVMLRAKGGAANHGFRLTSMLDIFECCLLCSGGRKPYASVPRARRDTDADTTLRPWADSIDGVSELPLSNSGTLSS